MDPMMVRAALQALRAELRGRQAGRLTGPDDAGPVPDAGKDGAPPDAAQDPDGDGDGGAEDMKGEGAATDVTCPECGCHFSPSDDVRDGKGGDDEAPNSGADGILSMIGPAGK